MIFSVVVVGVSSSLLTFLANRAGLAAGSGLLVSPGVALLIGTLAVGGVLRRAPALELDPAMWHQVLRLLTDLVR